jgi:hypothetical protein
MFISSFFFSLSNVQKNNYGSVAISTKKEKKMERGKGKMSNILQNFFIVIM